MTLADNLKSLDTGSLSVLAGHLADEIGKGVSKYGPQVWDTVLLVRRIDSIEYILTGIFLVIAALLIHKYITMSAYNKGWEGRWDEGCAGWFLLTFFGGVVSAAMTVAGCSYLLNIWTWVGIFYPQLAIAHDVIQGVISKVTGS